MRDTERARERQRPRQREKQASNGEPDVRLDPETRGHALRQTLNQGGTATVSTPHPREGLLLWVRGSPQSAGALPLACWPG